MLIKLWIVQSPNHVQNLSDDCVIYSYKVFEKIILLLNVSELKSGLTKQNSMFSAHQSNETVLTLIISSNGEDKPQFSVRVA